MPSGQSDTIPSPAHWSKDFVEHLRSVHFTLIGVSIGLIVIVLSAKPYNSAVALRQIHQIIQLKKVWSTKWILRYGVKKSMNHDDIDDDDADTKLREPAAQNHERNSRQTDFSKFGEKTEWDEDPLLPDPTRDEGQFAPKHLGSKGNAIIPATGQLYGHFGMEKSQNTTVQFSIKQIWEQNHTDPDWSPDSFPSSLYEFRQWWDNLAAHKYSAIFARTIDSGDVWLDPGTDPDYTDRVNVSLIEDPGRDKTSSLETVDLSLDADVYLDSLDFHGFDRKGLFYWVPVRRFVYVEVSQPMLAAEFKNWKTGNFDDSFPDLAREAQDLNTLELEDTEKFISAEAAKGSEVFEVFGMKFPTGEITLWGTIILLGVQLYFYMYLRQLSGKLVQNDAGWDVPWLGMNSSFLAQTIFFLTVVLLPCLAIGLLGEHSVWQTSEPLTQGHFPAARAASLTCALIMDLMLGTASWRCRPKVQVQIQPSRISEDPCSKAD